MRLRILSCLLLLAVSFDAAANNLYTTINRLRAGDGNCAVAGNLPPLRPQSALERVARDLAHGNKLESSLQAAGYRAERSIAFSGRGDDVGAQAEAMLARQSACRQLQDGTMTEVGVYLDARQFWIVLAAPHLQLAPQTSHSPLAPVISTREQAVGHRILDLINQARARPRYCGNQAFNAAPPVRWNEALAASSRRHSEDMARNDYFDHISPRDGSHSWERVERAGYRYSTTGENIAAGYDNAEEAVAGWLKSPGHCANLMNPAFVDMGAALAVNRSSKMGSYWTQEFGRPL